MPSPAFIVEGLMEQKIVQRICPGTPVRRIGCNGETAKMETVAKFIKAQIRALPRGHSPVIIVMDREKRAESCETLIDQLKSCLLDTGCTMDIVIGMPDRSFECWMLYDVAAVERHFDVTNSGIKPEEGFGKGKLKNVSRKQRYHEPTDGVDLFLKADKGKIYTGSPSFRNFVDQLPDICYWLRSFKRTACGFAEPPMEARRS